MTLHFDLSPMEYLLTKLTCLLISIIVHLATQKSARKNGSSTDFHRSSTISLPPPLCITFRYSSLYICQISLLHKWCNKYLHWIPVQFVKKSLILDIATRDDAAEIKEWIVETQTDRILLFKIQSESGEQLDQEVVKSILTVGYSIYF